MAYPVCVIPPGCHLRNDYICFAEDALLEMADQFRDKGDNRARTKMPPAQPLAKQVEQERSSHNASSNEPVNEVQIVDTYTERHSQDGQVPTHTVTYEYLILHTSYKISS